MGNYEYCTIKYEVNSDGICFIAWLCQSDGNVIFASAGEIERSKSFSGTSVSLKLNGDTPSPEGEDALEELVSQLTADGWEPIGMSKPNAYWAYIFRRTK